jgi:predicted nucleotidyltransferase
MDTLLHMLARLPSASALREPLRHVLGSPAKVAALRALAAAGEPITQRDVARRAGVLHRSIQLALNDLVHLGVITRQVGGRDYLVRINRAHRLSASITALFTAEAGHFLELRQKLAAVANGIPRRSRPMSVALFGSVARAVDTPSSDCDLLIIAGATSGLDICLNAFIAAADDIRETIGSRIAPIGYLRAEASRSWKSRRAPFDTIRRDALTVYGIPLAEALGDTR